MREAFLQFVWQQQFLLPTAMVTTTGLPVQVVKAGVLNHLSGPDFSIAEVVINGVTWHGSVEVHYRSSDWFLHHHEEDLAYGQVVLHVVWFHDQEIPLPDGSFLPTLTLAGHIPPSIIERYQHMLAVPEQQLPCSGFKIIDRLERVSMLDHAIWLRLHRKAQEILDMLALNQWDWENTLWQWLAQAYGFKANATAMMMLARAVPIRTLRRHRDIQRHTEAMLLGCAGFLDGPSPSSSASSATPEAHDANPIDDYHQQLLTDWQWLANKFQLISHQLIRSQWKTGGMRPGNAPITRITQLAALVHHVNSFQNLLAIHDIPTLLKTFRAEPLPYWQSHNAPGKPCKPHPAGMGEDSARVLLLNVVAPVQVAFAIHNKEPELVHKAMELLEQLPPESNNISKLWKHHGWPQHTALDTQAGLELHSQFCAPKRCLHCRVGQAIVAEGQERLSSKNMPAAVGRCP